VIVIMLLAWAEECPADDMGRHLLATTDSCPVSFFPGVRQGVSTRLGTFEGPCSRHGRSIAAEATWRLDADEVVEIEIDYGLQGGAGGGVTQIEVG
jgi:hypothetical protein